MIFQEKLISSLKKGNQNIAIQSSMESITYLELLEKSNRLTKRLLHEELPKGTYIGVILDGKTDIIVAMIGIMCAGHVFVPMDQALPNSKLQKMMEQLELEYVISLGGSVLELFKDLHHFSIRDTFDLSNPRKDASPVFDADDSLYVYFTSGSTGMPKGVIGKNASLTQFIEWEIKTYQLDDSLRCSQFISPYFDAFLRDVFVPIFSGGTICIPPNTDDFFTPKHMNEWINESKISLIHCVPSIFRIFNDSQFVSTESFKNLKYVLLSGEKIIPSELKNWYEIFNDRIQLVNLYGTTETTMVRMYYNIQKEDVHKLKMDIGQPIDDTEILILDMHAKPCKPLVVGDIYIVSEYISNGYLKNEALNKERFLLLDHGKKAFKTGDKGRLSFDGTIELLGREDRQVKLRGIRIELDEIENVLANASLTEQIIAIKHESDIGQDMQNESLVVFAKRKKEISTNLISDLEDYAKAHLSNYMIPSRIIEVDNFSYLSNGKIDLKSLQELLVNTTEDIIEPTTPIQEKLKEIWTEILGEQAFSVTDNFLKKGGNSLNLMRLIAKIYSEFEVRIPLSALFKNLTIESQEAFIASAFKEANFTIEKVDERDYYPITAAQRRIYFQYILDTSSVAYNLPVAFKLNTKIEATRIDAIFQQLIKRHESLRTVFTLHNGNIVQKIKEGSDFSISQLKADNLNSALKTFIQPFDIEKGPLLRAAVLETADSEAYFIFDIHHIICDGVSQINLFRDFVAIFDNQSLAPLHIQCKDFAVWEEQFVASEFYQNQGAFWLESFKTGIPKLPFTEDVDNHMQASSLGKNIVFTIEKQEVESIMNFVSDDNMTKSSVLLTLFMTFLVRLTGQDNLVIGLPSSGRLHDEVIDLVGMFVKTLPVNIKLDLNESFLTNLTQLHLFLTKAYDNQLYDLTDIITQMNKHDLSELRNMFDIMFTFQNFEAIENNHVSKIFEPCQIHVEAVKYPMEVIVSENLDHFTFNMEYNTELFTEEEIQAVISLLKDTVNNIPNNLENPLINSIDQVDESLDPSNDDLIFNF